MLYANTSEARIGGRDIDVPCNPLKLPAYAGELGIKQLSL